MEGIKILRVVNGMTQAELSQRLQIAQNTLSNWENGNREPDADGLIKTARFFGVSVDTILQMHYRTGQCPECGMQYCADISQDIAEHNRRHTQWQLGVKQHGFCWPYAIREDVKGNGWVGLMDTELSFEERIEYCIGVFKAWFSRSLEAANYNASHVSFPTYVAMRLNQEDTIALFPADIGIAMIERFGKSEGIAKGSYYTIPHTTKKRAASDKSQETLYTVTIKGSDGTTYSSQVTLKQAHEIKTLLS